MFYKIIFYSHVIMGQLTERDAGWVGGTVMILFAICIFTTIIGAIIGSKKGCLGAGLMLGMLLGPIGIIIILVMKGNKNKQCGFCKEYIHEQATICPRCQKEQAA